MNYVLFILVIAGLVVIYTLMLTPQITPPSSLSSQTPPGHPEFVGVDSKYVCVLCNNVLQDAVQTQCGHRLCQPCVDTYLQDGQPRPCPYQEEFCEMLQADQVSRGSTHFVPIDIWNLYAIAILLNLFIWLFISFLLMAVYVYFFILPIAVCFLNAHCLLFYSDTPGYQKIHQCKTLCLENGIYLDHLGSYLVYIWFIFFLESVCWLYTDLQQCF